MFMYANSGENFFFLVRINFMSMKRKKLTPIYIWEKNLVSRQLTCTFSNKTAFIKNRITVLKSLLTLTARISFAFDSRFLKKNNKKKQWDFCLAVFWVGGKNCKLLPKMKNVSYFPNYDMLIRNLKLRQFQISFLFWYLSRNIST